MVVTVIGSTGNVGSELVRLLSAAGVPTRAIHRRPSELPLRPNVVWLRADLRDPSLLEPALAGSSRLFLLTNNEPGFAELQQQIVAAAERAGVEHVVKLSAFGASPRSASAIAREHWQVEQALQQTAMSWTILRPHSFMQDWLGDVAFSVRSEGVIYAPLADARVPFIDARDVAAVAAVVLREPEAHRGQKLFLSGPAAVSMSELAEVMSAELARSIVYRDVTPEHARMRWKARGLSDGVIDGLLAFAAYQRAAGDGASVSDVVQTVLGRPARTIRDFVHDHAAHFR